RRISPGAHTIAPAASASDAVRAVIGVRTVDAVVDVVVGIGPEVVIGVRPVHVIKQVVIGVGPEQRSEPAEDKPAPPPRRGRTEERSVESRLPELRWHRDVGEGAVAEYPAPWVAHACRSASERVGRRGGEPVARAAEPRRRHAGTLRTATSDRMGCNARAADVRPAETRHTPGQTAASDGMSRNASAAHAPPANMRRTQGNTPLPA